MGERTDAHRLAVGSALAGDGRDAGRGVGSRCFSARSASRLLHDEQREVGRIANAQGAPAPWRSGDPSDGFLVRPRVGLVTRSAWKGSRWWALLDVSV